MSRGVMGPDGVFIPMRAARNCWQGPYMCQCYAVMPCEWPVSKKSAIEKLEERIERLEELVKKLSCP